VLPQTPTRADSSAERPGAGRSDRKLGQAEWRRSGRTSPLNCRSLRPRSRCRRPLQSLGRHRIPCPCRSPALPDRDRSWREVSRNPLNLAARSDWGGTRSSRPQNRVARLAPVHKTTPVGNQCRAYNRMDLGRCKSQRIGLRSRRSDRRLRNACCRTAGHTHKFRTQP